MVNAPVINKEIPIGFSPFSDREFAASLLLHYNNLVTIQEPYISLTTIESLPLLQVNYFFNENHIVALERIRFTGSNLKIHLCLSCAEIIPGVVTRMHELFLQTFISK